MPAKPKADPALVAIQEHFASDPANGRNRDFGHELGVLLGVVTEDAADETEADAGEEE